MGTVETGTRSCGECENFDRYDVAGEPVGTIKLLVTKNEQLQNVQLGLCRAPCGLLVGARAETDNCVHSEFKDRPVFNTKVQPESVSGKSKKFLPVLRASI